MGCLFCACGAPATDHTPESPSHTQTHMHTCTHTPQVKFEFQVNKRLPALGALTRPARACTWPPERGAGPSWSPRATPGANGRLVVVLMAGGSGAGWPQLRPAGWAPQRMWAAGRARGPGLRPELRCPGREVLVLAVEAQEP